jgi:RNase adaptor protein for sRNA GlmZ degradation
MVISFGYRHGVPQRADHVFDVRTLTHDVNAPAFLDTFRNIVEYGRQHPNQTLAIGCEQGKHRSVVLANKVATALRTSVYLRDKGR